MIDVITAGRGCYDVDQSASLIIRSSESDRRQMHARSSWSSCEVIVSYPFVRNIQGYSGDELFRRL